MNSFVMNIHINISDVDIQYVMCLITTRYI